MHDFCYILLHTLYDTLVGKEYCAIKECTYVANATILPGHCFPTAGVAAIVSLPSTSSLLSSIVPQIFHLSSFPFNIIFCNTRYSTTSFSSVVLLGGPSAGTFSRLCIDFNLTTTWYIADFSISSVAIFVLTLREKRKYLCRVHCRFSLGGRTLIRVRNEVRSPS